MCRRPALTAALFLVAAIALAAGQEPGPQAPAPPPVFRSSGTTVLVDALVRDGRNRFVADLRADDFELQEDGRPRPITALYRVVGPADRQAVAVASAPPAPPPERSQRVFVFVFEKGGIESLAGLNRARDAIIEFIRMRFRRGDLGGIVDGSVLVNNRLTTSREELIAALTGLRLQQNLGDPLQTLAGLAYNLARRPGRKTIVLLTGSGRILLSPTSRRDVADLAARADVRIYGLDTRGLGAATSSRQLFGSDSWSAEDAADAMLAGLPTLLSFGESIEDSANGLASDTGGYMIRNENDFGRALAEIDNDTSSYYVLGFSPASGDDGRFHDIKVKVKRQGARVRARSGYWAAAAPLISRRVKASADVSPAPASGGVPAAPPADATRPARSPEPATVARPQAPVPTFKTSTDLVEVEVSARDGRKRFVGDLQASDFEVREDGVLQEVAAIYRAVGGGDERIGLAGAPGDRPALPPPQTTRRVVVLFFDQAHILPGQFERAKKAALEFLATSFREGDVGGIFDGTRIVGDRLASSRAQLADAVRGLATTPQMLDLARALRDHPRMALDQARAVYRNEPSLRTAGGQAIDDVVKQACDDRPDDCSDAVARDLIKAQIAAKATELHRIGRLTADATLRAIRGIVDRLAPVSARKTLVLLSSGFFVDESLTELRQTTERAVRASVSIYALDTRGLDRDPLGTDLVSAVGPQEPGTSSASASTLDHGPNALASDSGGFTIRNENDFGKALAEIDRDSSSYYVLGFRSATPPDGRYHKLTVRVARRGVTIRARAGYLAVPRETLAVSGNPAEAQVVDPTDIGNRALSIRLRSADEILWVAGAELRPGSTGELPPAEAERAEAGWDAYARGDQGEAKQNLAGIAGRPDAPPWVRYVLGWAHLALGDPASARECWQALVTEVPGFEAVYFDLAAACWEERDYARALERMREAEARWPLDADVHGVIGYMLLGLGDVDEAIGAFEQAVRVDPDDEEALFGLSRTCEIRFDRAERSGPAPAGSADAEERAADRTRAVDGYRKLAETGHALAAQARERLKALEQGREKRPAGR